MRLLFVSDTHLGFDLPGRPRVERRRRGPDFFANFERALQPALDGEVDAVLHGGDLLFRSRVSAALTEAALAPLKKVASRGVPVLLVPGNHERSRLPYPLLGLHERLHVFDRPRTFVLEARGLRVAFAGFPYARQVRSGFRGLLEATGVAAAPADVRVLCLHHCVEGATCGPGDFTFRHGDDVIRAAELPRGFAAVLSGHLHRHQVLRHPGAPPVLYAGSVERTSFAEAPETKGYLRLDFGAAGLERFGFHPLPARPMRVCQLWLEGSGEHETRAKVAAALEATEADAVVQLRLAAPPAAAGWPVLSAPSLRALAGGRNVTLAGLPGATRDVG